MYEVKIYSKKIKEFFNLMDFIDKHKNFISPIDHKIYEQEKNIKCKISSDQKYISCYFMNDVRSKFKNNDFYQYEFLEIDNIPTNIDWTYFWTNEDENGPIGISPVMVDKSELDFSILLPYNPYTYNKNKQSIFENIFVFGDSFSDTGRHFKVHDIDKLNPIDGLNKAWLQQLVEELNPKNYYNFSKRGVGILYALDKFDEQYSNITSNDLVLFFMSKAERIHFDNELYTYNIYYDYEKKCSSTKKNECDYTKQYFLDHKDHIDFFYRNTEKELKRMNLKTNLYLKYYTHLKGNTTILYDCFEPPINTSDKNFFVYPHCLKDISLREIGFSCDDIEYKDPRINHLSKENHEVMFQNTMNILTKKPLIEYKNLNDFYASNTYFIYK